MEDYMNDEFAGVPYEIVSMICGHLDTAALINLQYTCRSLRQLVGEYLWHTVDINGFSDRLSYNLDGASPAVVTSMGLFYEGVKSGSLAVPCTYVRNVTLKVPGLRGLADDESSRLAALTAEFMADIIPQYFGQLNCLSVVSKLVYDSTITEQSRAMATEAYNNESNWAAHISNMFVQMPSVAKHLKLEMGEKPPSRPLAMANLRSLRLCSRFSEHIEHFLQLGLPATLEVLELDASPLSSAFSAKWLKRVTSECENLARLDLSQCIVSNPRGINYVPDCVTEFAPPMSWQVLHPDLYWSEEDEDDASNGDDGNTPALRLSHVTTLDLDASSPYHQPMECPALSTLRVYKDSEGAMPIIRDLVAAYDGVANIYIEHISLGSAVELMESPLGASLQRLALAGVSVGEGEPIELALSRLAAAINKGTLQELYLCPLFELDYAKLNAILQSLHVKDLYLANCLQCREEEGWRPVHKNSFNSPYYSFFAGVYFNLQR
ncbi:hypothetical protein TRVA0_005S01420 [Trichomonascus vanleenenianus]|uniref:F-box protein n=1 Tax=Trichomonascus vanleenenianus TaxID=2268995 RepID=UPI003EC99DBC